MPKRIVRALIENNAAGSLLGLAERLEPSRPYLLRALTYHRIVNVVGFQQQMAYLAKHYNVIGQTQLIKALDEAEPLPARSILITFDDADRDVAEIAWPVLQQHGLPAVLFVPTAFPDQPQRLFWWDRLEHAIHHTTRGVIQTPLGPLPTTSPTQRRAATSSLKRYLAGRPSPRIEAHVDRLCERMGVDNPQSRVLGWDELRRLHGEGMDLAAHTRTHPILTHMSDEAVLEEIAGSRDDLEREIGVTPQLFAYPNGRYSLRIADLVAQAGLKAAFTTQRGTTHLGKTHCLRMRRNNVGPYAIRNTLKRCLVQSSVYFNPWRAAFKPDPPYDNGDRPESADGRKLPFVNARPLYKAVDAMITAPLRQRRTLANSLRSVFGLRTAHFDRVAAVMTTLDRIVPGTAKWVSTRLHRPPFTPTSGSPTTLYAFGSGSTVYVGPEEEDREVVKVSRKSLGRGRKMLHWLLAEYSVRHDILLNWYHDAPWLVLPGRYMVLPGPLLRRPAVACVQPFVAGRQRDVFKDFDEQQFIELLASDTTLHRQFEYFAQRTLEIRDRENRCPDILGEGNLVIVEHEGQRNIRLVDYGLFDLEEADTLKRGLRRSLEARLKQLEDLGRLASAIETQTTGTAV